ncbi:uncharacterized protein MJAP1_001869 [Malassezia japonica]|uniref:triacylglycerol lipase n=1 Tax=Malassezia japonica TaxID=223818 RepID=A0AAF0F5W3_9BASI|nr:uncharacterized protein MJAP1_001869 [Malassezia japonica]WFD38903.1 hypothetical protein MJAP1_001869 [Malassezia japonica]
MDSQSDIVGMGYSGGAIAGGWAASLQSAYAPELNVKGWAIGGTPSNLSATFYGLDAGLFAGFAAAGLAGVVDSYPEANDYVGSVITEEGNKALQFTREQCMGDIILGLRNVNILNQSFVSNTNNFLHADAIQGLLQTLTMGADPKLTPKAPVYMYHSVHDEVIPFAMANRTAKLCNPLWQPDILGAKLTEVFNAVSNLFGTDVGRGDQILKEHIQGGKF